MNLALIEALEAEGLSGDAIVRVLKASMSEPQRSSAAIRQARYRKNKAKGVTSDVTGDVTDPPKDNIKPPNSVSDETGVPPNPAKQIFDLAISVLVSAGHSDRQARSLAGKWRKAVGDGEVLAGLMDCQARSISNPVEWLEKRFAAKSAAAGPLDFLDFKIAQRREQEAWAAGAGR